MRNSSSKRKQTFDEDLEKDDIKAMIFAGWIVFMPIVFVFSLLLLLLLWLL